MSVSRRVSVMDSYHALIALCNVKVWCRLSGRVTVVSSVETSVGRVS
jgi:hypothetical protein